MKMTKLLCMFTALALTAAIVAGCTSSPPTPAPVSTPTPAQTTPAASTPEPATEPATVAEPEREFYEFSYYENYDWAAGDLWDFGVQDKISQHWSEKFGIKLNLSAPDANAEEALNLRISANDLPEAIWMDRGPTNIRMARLGMFIDLDTLKPMLDNNWYDDNILQQTQEQLKIDGKLYGVPNWARKAASGGNNAWMVTTDIYNTLGSPELKTYDDLFNYAIAIRDSDVKSPEGLDVIPMATEDTGGDGRSFVRAIYRSLGAPYDDDWAYGRVGDSYKNFMRDPLYQEALLEANKWFTEGLLKPTNFTDTREQFLEKLKSARIGLMWYDHSQNDGNSFRTAVRETYPGNSVELVTVEQGGKTYLYLPANGLSYDKIYGEHYSTIGWNVTCITTAAKYPERIFEFMSYLLTKEGSIEMMYGPQGICWNELDAMGNPIIVNNPALMTEEERNDIGVWHSTLAGHADNVDLTKFAVNDAQPPELRNWVESCQAHIFTPLMAPLTDEFLNIRDTIENDTTQGEQRKLCEDYLEAQIPKIIMASSAGEAQKMIDEANAFLDANGMTEVEATYNVKYQENLAMQGGTIFNR